MQAAQSELSRTWACFHKLSFTAPFSFFLNAFLPPLLLLINRSAGFPGTQMVRIHQKCRRPWFNSWVGKFLRRRDRLPTPVFLGFPGGSDSKESTCNAGDLGSIPGLAGPVEEGMATHSSILAWRILWTEEPGWLQAMGSQRVTPWPRDTDRTEWLSTIGPLIVNWKKEEGAQLSILTNYWLWLMIFWGEGRECLKQFAQMI